VPPPRRTPIDLLAWFADHERGICPDCGEKALVTVSRSRLELCLACGTMLVDGVRLGGDTP
jgi:hypothetical protein